jgi:hypothetical protein
MDFTTVNMTENQNDQKSLVSLPNWNLQKSVQII